MVAFTGGNGFYDYDVWENSKVLEGSATVALLMAEELGYRIRYSTPIASIELDKAVSTVRAVTGETFQATHVISALPAGPLRDVVVTGVSEARLSSLHRQQHAPAVKYVAVYESSFWESQGQNGTGYFETTIRRQIAVTFSRQAASGLSLALLQGFFSGRRCRSRGA